MEPTPGKIGLFGGTFNPVHIGHVAIVEASLNYLDHVVVMPCRISPHKLEQQDDPHFVSGEDRFRMLELCFGKMESVEVSRWEIDRDGVSYTWETINHLQAQYSGSEIHLILGRDQFEVLETWHRFDDWKDKVSFLIFDRSSGESKTPSGSVNSNSRRVFASEEIPHLSSSQIRKLLGSDDIGWVDLTPSSVSEYIRHNGLYISI